MRRIKKALWRNILLIGAVFAFGLVLYNSRAELSDTWELLKRVPLYSLLLLPILQLSSYFMLSGYYRSFLKAFGGKISKLRSFGITTALNFVNQVLPSGGASGITYLIYAYKDAGNSAQLTLIQIGRYLLAFLSYVPLLIVAFISLGLAGELNKELDIALFVLLIISLPGTVLLVIAIKNQKVLEAFVAKVLAGLNRIAMFFTRRKVPPIAVSKSHGFLKDFHEGVKFIKSQRGRLMAPYLHIQASTIIEVTIVITAFWILGVSIHPGVIIIAFTAANVVGAISVIPGDVGVHELAIITVLSYIGVDQGTAIAGTLLYRVFNKLVSMLIGFSFYVRMIKPLIETAKKPKYL